MIILAARLSLKPRLKGADGAWFREKQEPSHSAERSWLPGIDSLKFGEFVVRNSKEEKLTFVARRTL